MAVDIAAVTETTWEPVRKEPEARYTAVVIWDGTSYSAVCRDLDIAAVGDTAGEAFLILKSAVREAIAVAAEKGVKAGDPVNDKDLAEFLALHKAPQPVAGYVFTV